MKTELKTEFVRVRVAPELKMHVHHIFEELGLSPSQAISLFYKKVESEHGIPFDLHIPNPETTRAMRETEKGIGVKAFKTKEDLFKDLGI